MKKAILALLAWPLLAVAQPWWLNGAKSNSADFLPPDAAFQVSSVIDGNLIRVRWLIADRYYLYRAKFDIIPESPDLILDKSVYPKGTTKTDEYFGTQEIYTTEVTAVVGFKRIDAGAHPVEIRVTYQGCAEAGLCYPPLTKVLRPDTIGEASASPMATAVAPAPAGSQAVAIGILGGALAFFLAGLGVRRKHNPTAL